MPQTDTTLLIVNDDKAILVSSSQLCAVPGIRVITAEHAAEAIEKIKAEKPDILLLDVTIPASEFEVNLSPGAEYLNSKLVAEEFKRQRPDGKLLLHSSYAEEHKAHFPDDAEILHIQPRELRDVMHRVLQELHMDRTETATDVCVETPEEHEPRPISHVRMVRESQWHTGHAEACDQAGSTRVSHAYTRRDDGSSQER